MDNLIFKDDTYQLRGACFELHNYLHSTGHQLGLLINFGHHPKVEIERIIL